MKKLTIMISAFILMLTMGVTQVGATSTSVLDNENVTILSSDTASDFGMDTMTSSDDNYYKVYQVDYDTYNVEYWLEYNVVYVKVNNAKERSLSHMLYLTESDNTLIYNFGAVLTSSYNGDEYFKITVHDEKTIKLGFWYSGSWADSQYSGYIQETNVAPGYMSLTTTLEPSVIENIFNGLSGIVSGFIALMIVLFADTGVIAIFYDSVDGLTVLGGLLLIGAGYGMVRWAFGYVRRLLQFRG